MSLKISELTETQIQQISEYLAFDKSKRNEIRTEISGDLSDLLNSTIDPNQIYTGKEALELMNQVPTTLNKTVNSELERQRDISCVLIQHIFQQAQEHNISIELDTPQLEDEDATDAANSLCNQILAHNSPFKAPTATNVQKQENSPDTNVTTSLEELRAENQRLKDQLSKPLRQWPEFITAMNQLKDLNSKLHQVQ